jgi:hypothetical protein
MTGPERRARIRLEKAADASLGMDETIAYKWLYFQPKMLVRRIDIHSKVIEQASPIPRPCETQGGAPASTKRWVVPELG